MATILIIDDSPTELHLFQGMLEKSGFETLVADSGEDGIRQAIILGSVMASFNVEDFSLNRLKNLTNEEIKERYGEFKRLTHFESLESLPF